MKCAMRGRRNPISSAGSSVVPGAGATTAMTSSSPSSVGTADRRRLAHAGCAQDLDLDLDEEMFSPRRRIASFSRSTKK